MVPVNLGLVHYPVLNRKQEIVSTSITNLDLHDMARLAATYGLPGFYVIHPLPAQQEMARNLLSFWNTGYGRVYNPDRHAAFTLVRQVETIAEAMNKIADGGAPPLLIATAANPPVATTPWPAVRQVLTTGTRPALLLFGTGWGLAPGVLEEADIILDPIKGPGDYNHLSVRSAASIILDRLCGER